MSADRFDRALDLAHQCATDYLRDQPRRHVGSRADRVELMAAIGARLSDKGEDDATVIKLLAAQGARGAVASGSRRYFGFVIGGTYPVALAADWLVSAWDQKSGIFPILRWFRSSRTSQENGRSTCSTCRGNRKWVSLPVARWPVLLVLLELATPFCGVPDGMSRATDALL